jgi:hypothetical protein
MEQQAREQAFMKALATEQFVLQAARSANVGEMTGRATVYMGAVSSALIASGFLAQVVTHLDPFVAEVLPAVSLLGEFTFAALLQQHPGEPGVAAVDAADPRATTAPWCPRPTSSSAKLPRMSGTPPRWPRWGCGPGPRGCCSPGPS